MRKIKGTEKEPGSRDTTVDRKKVETLKNTKKKLAVNTQKNAKEEKIDKEKAHLLRAIRFAFSSAAALRAAADSAWAFLAFIVSSIRSLSSR